jgi:orotate phosphoribosyltransferase
MTKNTDAAFKIAEYLLQVKAIKLQPDKPFVWASGWQSPIYCDNRVTLSYPKIRTFIRQLFSEEIARNYVKPDVIAGVATGGIAHGALVAEELGLPFVYVRSDSKKHGLGNQIEGRIEKGQSVVVIEDLISTGGSSLNAVAALREAGAQVKGLISIFTYDFKVSQEAFKKAKCTYTSLCDYHTLIEQALKANFINEDEMLSLERWREDPANWKPATHASL